MCRLCQQSSLFDHAALKKEAACQTAFYSLSMLSLYIPKGNTGKDAVYTKTRYM